MVGGNDLGFASRWTACRCAIVRSSRKLSPFRFIADFEIVTPFPVFFRFLSIFFLWIFFLVIKNNLVVSILLADFEIVISFPVFFGFLSIFFFMNIFLVIKNNLSVLLRYFDRFRNAVIFFGFFLLVFFIGKYWFLVIRNEILSWNGSENFLFPSNDFKVIKEYLFFNLSMVEVFFFFL